VRKILSIENLCKDFELHQQGGACISVLKNINLEAASGEGVAIVGPSGRGKSSLLKLIYGTYRASNGTIKIRHGDDWVNIAETAPRVVMAIRHHTLGYVTQFLRVIPRVPALEVVIQPMMARGSLRNEAESQARRLLNRLNIPEKLWSLSPTTFSGGEQQRVNIARGFAVHHPILLLDEPTASLDPENRSRVLELVNEARAKGSAVIGIFHDEKERHEACERAVFL
jgi:alpha-D-ribose 1-methylphosphonate 5-triphosphate synthase subunit PhnL